MFIAVHVIDANSKVPDQAPLSVASDLGLHCLPLTLLDVSRLKLVKKEFDTPTMKTTEMELFISILILGANTSL